jgi:arabinose-5-phosphate isomerase
MKEKDLFISIAKKTIETEIKGLKSLINFFDQKFYQAIDTIIKCKGKVILSGMGKSGHIANKIAATLASTGTPSFFIHPSEASHGDLGMISSQDIVILLSNSGETKELRDIIYYCKRFEIPIIGIIRKNDSELAKVSNIALILPAIPEANKINAPTTSTTMMLALGDAIASCLIEAKKFNSEKFNIFHPGGKLGATFLKVADLMRKNNEVPLVSYKDNIQQAILEMTSKHLGCTGVIDKNKQLIGIITDGDLRRNISDKFYKLNTTLVMSKKPITVEQNMLVAEAILIMNKKRITSLFVVDNKKIVGVLHIHDCLRSGIL